MRRRGALRALGLVVAACSGPGAGDAPVSEAPSASAPAPQADGWRSLIAANEARMEALLDASPGWKALFDQRPFEAADAFRAGAQAGPVGAAHRIGLARALLAAADALEQAADVLTLAQRPLVAQLAAATPPVPGAVEWRTYLEASPGAPASAPVSSGPAPYAAPTTHLQPPGVPGQAQAEERTPVYDPGPARSQARALRLEAVAAVCPPSPDTAAKLACGLARAAAGETTSAQAVLREALAAPDWTPETLLPLLVFDWLDTPAELRALVDGLVSAGAAPSRASDAEAAAWRAGCRLAPAGRDCAAGVTLSALDASLRAGRRASTDALETLPADARALMRTLDAVETRTRGRAASDARVLLAAGRPVDAFALCTSGGAPAGAEAAGRGEAGVPVNLAAHAALARAALETDNAQLAFQSCGELAPQAPAWAAAREAVRLFGLSLVARGGGSAGAVGGAKPE